MSINLDEIFRPFRARIAHLREHEELRRELEVVRREHAECARTIGKRDAEVAVLRTTVETLSSELAKAVKRNDGMHAASKHWEQEISRLIDRLLRLDAAGEVKSNGR